MAKCCDKPDQCKCCSTCVDCDCCKSGNCSKSEEPCCKPECQTDGCKCERTKACHGTCCGLGGSKKPCCDKPGQCKCCSTCEDCDCCKSSKCAKSEEPCCKPECKTDGCKCERTKACHESGTKKPCCDKPGQCKCCSTCVDCDCCKSGKCTKSVEPCCKPECQTDGCKCERTKACHGSGSKKPCCDKPGQCKCCSTCVDCDCCKSGKCSKSEEPCCKPECKTDGCKCERTKACHGGCCGLGGSKKPCCDKPGQCKCCSTCVDCDCCKSGKCSKSEEPCCKPECKTDGCKCERTKACHGGCCGAGGSKKPCCDKPGQCKCCSTCVDCDCCKSGKCSKSEEPCCKPECKTDGCKCERTKACHAGCCAGKKCC